ncbi:MAG: RNA methyltransferase [bacterium]
MRIVLCEPQEPGNIGSVARAMKTMGLSDLVLVAPTEPWLTEVAHGMAHSSQRLLHAAKVFPNLAAAVADCALVIGTTTRRRHRDLRFLDPEEAVALALSISATAPVALVFGNERTGLTNEQLEMCHHVSRVPLAVHQPSLNLAQCVMVFAYVWRRAQTAENLPRPRGRVIPGAPTPAAAASLARSESLERMFASLDEAIDSLAFPANVGKRVRLSLRNLLLRSFLKEREVNLFHTIAAQIKHRAATPPPRRPS